jgi:hypothetical protein
MPYKDPDPTDPNMLVGVVLPAAPEATRDMAYVFAEEFARMGYRQDELLRLFKNPFYGGAHGAYQILGENEILSIIDECINAWGQAKFSILDFGFSIGEKNCQEPNSEFQSAERSLGEPGTTTTEHSSKSEQSKIEKRPRGPKSKMDKGWR